MKKSAKKTNAAEFEADQDNVFARIADRYDFLCDIFSLYLHRGWKTRTAKMIAAQNPEIYLDVASGTGHVALRVKELLLGNKNIKITASDICPEMLAIAKAREPKGLPAIEFKIYDAHGLIAVKSNSVDLVSVSLAMKICNRKQVLKEAYRCLKPGGMLVCLEASVIPWRPLRVLYLKYMDWCLPLIGRLATGSDASAYLYFLKGIHKFPDQKTFATEMESHGFDQVKFKNMSLGTVALHTGLKPKNA